MIKLIFLFLILFSTANYAVDSNPIVVTPPSGLKNYGMNLSPSRIISREDIDESGAQSVVDILKMAPEITVNTTGAFGKSSSIFLRGTSNRHTLVLIDGIRVTDLTSISGGSRLELLDLSDVTSIEIIKGANSVLYGSEAIGGVIKINTTKASEIGTLGKVELGSFDNKAALISHAGVTGDLDYKLSTFFRDVEGISAFDNGVNENFEKDGFQNLRVNGKLGYAITNKDQIDFDISYEDSDIELDDSSSDNSLNEANYQTLRLSAIYEGEKSRLWNPRIYGTTQIVDRRVKTINNFGNSINDYEGSFKEFEVSNFSTIGPVVLTTGLNYEVEKADSLGNVGDTKRNRERYAAFVNSLISLSGFNLETGVRQDESQFNGSNTLYRVGFSKEILGWEFKVSQGTGFKAPSLFQVFSSYGNLNLNSEKAKTQDFSIKKKMENWGLEITYFTVDISNYIDYDSTTSTYINLGSLKNKGIEFFTQYNFGSIDASFGGTLSNPISDGAGTYASRRPRRKFDTSITSHLFNKVRTTIQGSYVGERNDTNGSRLPSYLVFNGTLGLDIGKWQTSLILNNILEKEYQEIRNYGVPGRNFLISLARKWP